MGTEQDQQPNQSGGQLTEKPEVTDEHKEKAKEMAKAYEDDPQTTTLPGSQGTVSGTAVTDWVDDKDNIARPRNFARSKSRDTSSPGAPASA
jgi:hypothetical protein